MGLGMAGPGLGEPVQQPDVCPSLPGGGPGSGGNEAQGKLTPQGFSASEISSLGTLGVCAWWEVGRECSAAEEMFGKYPNLAAHEAGD